MKTFWQDCWKTLNTPWKTAGVHPLALKLKDLGISPRSTGIPLCGDSPELLYFLEPPTAEVVGIELVEESIQKFVDDHGLEGHWQDGTCRRWLHSKGQLELWSANLLDLPHGGRSFDLVWDRACLVALQPEDRSAYRDWVLSALEVGGYYAVVQGVRKDKTENGPPFTVTDEDLLALFTPALTQIHRDSQASPAIQGKLEETLWVFRKN